MYVGMMAAWDQRREYLGKLAVARAVHERAVVRLNDRVSMDAYWDRQQRAMFV